MMRVKFPKRGDVVYGLAEPARDFANRYGLHTLKQRSTEHLVAHVASILTRDDYMADWVDAMKDDPKYGVVFEAGATWSHAGLPTPWSRWKLKTKSFMEFACRHTDALVMHFVLSGIDMVAVATKAAENDRPQGPAGPKFPLADERRSITGVELRWLYRNWDDPRVVRHCQFWDGAEDTFWPSPPPWECPRWRSAWALYEPRRRFTPER